MIPGEPHRDPSTHGNIVAITLNSPGAAPMMVALLPSIRPQYCHNAVRMSSVVVREHQQILPEGHATHGPASVIVVGQKDCHTSAPLAWAATP